jgi:ankyrin repeat protein
MTRATQRSAAGAACQNSQEAVVELLLERGADAGTPDADGKTPMIWAIRRDEVLRTVRTPLRHGCGDLEATMGKMGRRLCAILSS